jgi:hypothetical protein
MNATTTAHLTTSRSGHPLPVLDVRLPRGSHHRLVSATLHELAAKVERATAAGEGWVIYTEQHADEGGRVVVELAQATEAEAARALAMLRGLV